MDNVLSPRAIAAALTELWSPRVTAEVDEHYVKVARLQGTLGWHSHEHEDELFLVVQGSLRIDLEARSVTLAEGDLFVVPKSALHNPSAPDGCLVMLIENKSTRHTGDFVGKWTRSLEEQLRPV
jgi:mannose-6-phosphate isomerase-like protein (cupin superfamily)